MAKTLLVAVDFAAGLKVLEALDRSTLSIKVALWAYFGDYEEWRFALASPHLDPIIGPKAYRLVHETLEAAGISYEQTPPLMIFKMSDAFIRDLRRQFAKKRAVEGMHLGLQTFGNRWVEDSLVYRIR